MGDIFLYIAGFLIVSFGFVVFFGAPYVPTLKAQVEDIFDLYPLTKKDVFVDIGSGDGVVVRSAAKRGAQGIGYELNPWLFIISKLLSRKQKRVAIHFKNFWNTELPKDTSVVYTFLNGRYMSRLQTKLQNHVNATGRPLAFISYGFKMKDKKIIKQKGAMILYRFEPLQS